MKIEQGVLQELAQLMYVGDNAVVIERQLVRTEYAKVNKVLEALGGKWNRAQKRHIFPGDARALLDTVIATGQVTTAADRGFFPTPDPVAEPFVDWVMQLGPKEDRVIFEPSAGSGQLVKFAVKYGPVVAIDIQSHPTMLAMAKGNDRIHFSQRDLFQTRLAYVEGQFGRISHVIENPPFARTDGHDCLDHVRESVERFTSVGAAFGAIMPSSVLWRRDRRFDDFRAWLKSHEPPAGYEPSQMLPDGAFAASDTNVKTCMVRGIRRSGR